MYALFYVMLGGSLGAALRYGTGFLFGSGAQATLAVNVVGSLAMGLFAALAISREIPGEQSLWLFFVVGVLGAFTTFSAFSREVGHMLLNAQILKAAIFMAANTFGATLAFLAGFLALRAVSS